MPVPPRFITRNGGTAKLRMNAITRNAGSSISFLDGTVADTDRTNTNGILGGYATIGANWAVNSTNGADGAITALSTYDTWTNSGGSSTANYLLNGSDTLTGALAANSLKIANTDVNQTLNLGSNNLTVTSTSATTLGGRSLRRREPITNTPSTAPAGSLPQPPRENSSSTPIPAP